MKNNPRISSLLSMEDVADFSVISDPLLSALTEGEELAILSSDQGASSLLLPSREAVFPLLSSSLVSLEERSLLGVSLIPSMRNLARSFIYSPRTDLILDSLFFCDSFPCKTRPYNLLQCYVETNSDFSFLPISINFYEPQPSSSAPVLLAHLPLGGVDNKALIFQKTQLILCSLAMIQGFFNKIITSCDHKESFLISRYNPAIVQRSTDGKLYVSEVSLSEMISFFKGTVFSLPDCFLLNSPPPRRVMPIIEGFLPHMPDIDKSRGCEDSKKSISIRLKSMSVTMNIYSSVVHNPWEPPPLGQQNAMSVVCWHRVSTVMPVENFSFLLEGDSANLKKKSSTVFPGYLNINSSTVVHQAKVLRIGEVAPAGTIACMLVISSINMHKYRVPSFPQEGGVNCYICNAADQANPNVYQKYVALNYDIHDQSLLQDTVMALLNEVDIEDCLKLSKFGKGRTIPENILSLSYRNPDLLIAQQPHLLLDSAGEIDQALLSTLANTLKLSDYDDDGLSEDPLSDFDHEQRGEASSSGLQKEEYFQPLSSQISGLLTSSKLKLKQGKSSVYKKILPETLRKKLRIFPSSLLSSVRGNDPLRSDDPQCRGLYTSLPRMEEDLSSSLNSPVFPHTSSSPRPFVRESLFASEDDILSIERDTSNEGALLLEEKKSSVGRKKTKK